MNPINADRPLMPDGYGVPTTTGGLLSWSDVEPLLRDAEAYWLASVRPDGRPHVVPRWGVWLDNRFYYDGSPQTVHARNLEANPECALHLESGTRTVIVEGRSIRTSADPAALGARLAGEYAKYHDAGYRPEADAWSGPDGGGLRVLTPVRAFAWFSFPADCTRFRFTS